MGVACIDAQLKYRNRSCKQTAVGSQNVAPVGLDFIITDGFFFCLFAPFISFNKLNIGRLADNCQANSDHNKIDQINLL
ncbi:hypothetical protein DSECCO2_351970 [anaerobic digester metagenome]